MIEKTRCVSCFSAPWPPREMKKKKKKHPHIRGDCPILEQSFPWRLDKACLSSLRLKLQIMVIFTTRIVFHLTGIGIFHVNFLHHSPWILTTQWRCLKTWHRPLALRPESKPSHLLSVFLPPGKGALSPSEKCKGQFVSKYRIFTYKERYNFWRLKRHATHGTLHDNYKERRHGTIWQREKPQTRNLYENEKICRHRKLYDREKSHGQGMLYESENTADKERIESKTAANMEHSKQKLPQYTSRI